MKALFASVIFILFVFSVSAGKAKSLSAEEEAAYDSYVALTNELDEMFSKREKTKPDFAETVKVEYEVTYDKKSQVYILTLLTVDGRKVDSGYVSSLEEEDDEEADGNYDDNIVADETDLDEVEMDDELETGGGGISILPFLIILVLIGGAFVVYNYFKGNKGQGDSSDNDSNKGGLLDKLLGKKQHNSQEVTQNKPLPNQSQQNGQQEGHSRPQNPNPKNNPYAAESQSNHQHQTHSSNPYSQPSQYNQPYQNQPSQYNQPYQNQCPSQDSYRQQNHMGTGGYQQGNPERTMLDNDSFAAQERARQQQEAQARYEAQERARREAANRKIKKYGKISIPGHNELFIDSDYLSDSPSNMIFKFEFNADMSEGTYDIIDSMRQSLASDSEFLRPYVSKFIYVPKAKDIITVRPGKIRSKDDGWEVVQLLEIALK